MLRTRALRALLLSFLTLVLGALSLTTASSQTTPDAGAFSLTNAREWQDAAIISRNKLSAHAVRFPYSSREAALAGDMTSATNFLSLDGVWRFHWARSPAEAATAFWNPDASVATWAEMPVPSNWIRHGYGRYQYADEEYNFQMNVPHPPTTDNPVSSYVRDFDLPAEWAEQRIVLHFGSVRTAFYVWVNGVQVGYSEDSRLPAEFEVTNFVRPGRNRVAIQVIQWPDAAYLEGQDMWRQGGVERGVYLYATPHNYVRDYFVRAGLADDYTTGTYDLDVEVACPAEQGRASVRFSLLEPTGRTVQTMTRRCVSGQASRVNFEGRLPNVRRWTAETPNLYVGLIELVGPRGDVITAVSSDIGFRRVEIRDGQLQVNGRPIFIRGVNRQEFDPETLHVVSRESMERDVALMKQLNINALRLSHYPNDPYIYELADRYGLYVVDEANVESHEAMNVGDNLADRPEFREAHMDRMRRMVERDKNHPSVIIWSLGNEAGSGAAFQAMYDWVKAYDPSRPVQYEAAGDSAYTDIYVPMYAKVWDIRRYLASRPSKPLILCEYAHMMGNSGGTIQAYRELFYAHPQFQGGFIWDFVDQSLWVRRPDGTTFLGYPGEYVRDGIEFSYTDGLVAADRTLKEHALDARKAYEPVSIEAVAGEFDLFTFTSRYDFADTSNLAFHWRVEEDGAVVAHGVADAPTIPARGVARVRLALPASANDVAAERFVIVETRTRMEQNLVPANHFVSASQFALATPPASAAGPVAAAPVRWRETGRQLVADTAGGVVTFDRRSGFLSGLDFGGGNLLRDPLRPYFWRAMTDNDLGAGLHERLGLWRDLHQRARLASWAVSRGDSGALIVRTSHAYGDAATVDADYRVHGDGSIAIDMRFSPQRQNLPFMPRFGVRFFGDGSLDVVEWFGRGPQASYADRWAAALVGRYRGSVADQYYEFVRPQESGNKIDVRWMALRQGAAGGGLLIVGDPTFSGGVLAHTTEDLDQTGAEQRHSVDVPVRDFVDVHIDYRQMGLGGDDSWRSTAHIEHMLPPRAYRFSFTLAALPGAADPRDTSRRVRASRHSGN